MPFIPDDPKAYAEATKKPQPHGFVPDDPEAYARTLSADRQKNIDRFAESFIPYSGGTEALASMGSSLIAKPVSDIAGLAARGYEWATGQDDNDPQTGGAEGFRGEVRNRLTYEPRTTQGREALQNNPLTWLGGKIGQGAGNLGEAIRGGPDAGRARFIAGNVAEEVAPDLAAAAGAKILPPAIQSVGRLARGAGELVSAPSGRLVNNLTGAEASASRAQALAAARGELGAAASEQEVSALAAQKQAGLHDYSKSQVDAARKAAPPVPDLNAQGETIRGQYSDAIKRAKDFRDVRANQDIARVREEAAIKEASGLRVDTRSIENDLASMRKEAEGIPDLENQIDKMTSAIRGRQPGPAAPTQKSYGLIPNKAEPAGKMFDQLELTRRYLNDIAYSGNLEGYPAVIRNRARDVAAKLTDQMREFSASFDEYLKNYAKHSEPLVSLDTRFGRALSNTEGGLKGDAYAKVSPQDLPGRLFGKKDGVDLMVDALAGGKDAPPQVRAQAQAKVDQMVEDWIVETSPKEPVKALERLSAPNMRPTMAAVPAVQSKLEGKFKTLADLEKTSADLGKYSIEASERAQLAKQAASKIRDDVQLADDISRIPGEQSQGKALQAYENALTRAYRSGLVDSSKYRAAIDLINRSESIAAKSTKARRIVLGLLGSTAGAAIGAYGVSKAFQ